MKLVIETLRVFYSLYRFVKGYVVFLLTGRSPADARPGLAHLSNLTNGRLNDALVHMTRLRYPPRDRGAAVGVLGTLDESEAGRIAAKVREQGYYVFDAKLSPQVCDELVAFARTTPCIPMGKGSIDMLERFDYVADQARLYDSARPVSPRYDFDFQTTTENPQVQRLIIDPTLLAVAGRYLETEPVNDITTMWWSTAVHSGHGSSAAAQFYHCDTDRVRFLKFFFYLTDVDTDTGPHCLVARSHRRKPRSLLRGSRRISDEEIARHYPPHDILELAGPRGTILAVDNAGFHKGKPLLRGERLILQVLYATSRFGANYPPIKVNEKFSGEFLDAATRRPRIFENFDFSARR